MLVTITKVTKNFGFGNVFEDISFVVNSGDRIALVGKNGCGKSTLLKCIIGRESFVGTISVGRGIKLGYLEQTAPDRDDGRMVIDILKEPFESLYKRLHDLQEMEQKMCSCSPDKLEKMVDKYSELQEKFIADGGYEIDNEINYVVGGLKIDSRLLDREYNTLSGGEKTLVHFARILLDAPDLLLLDEPTNHLDIERIEWLESYIKRFKGGIVVVSHDRYFLDKVSTSVVDVEDNGEIYKGNYSNFVREKEKKQLKEFEQFKNEQKKLEELKKAVKRLREWGEQADNPTMFRRAKAIQKRIDEMEKVAVERPKPRKAIPIKFTNSERSGKRVVVINNLDLILGEKILFDGANLEIFQGEKIALIGANGMGKTSLIKCIMGDTCEYDGQIKVGESVRIGYLSQLLVFENAKETILEYVNRITGLNNENARRILARFEFFKDDIEKSVGTLSGGEKIRLKIACLLQNDVNTLVFDEPTNHIDIFTREILEEAMRAFKGTILFVSHDRYFINNIASHIVEINEGKLQKYEGNYDSYKHKDDVEIVEEKKEAKIKPTKVRKGGKW
ncbi:MAG: ABC-F type ribosomal protection protein [Clostridia bacterium]|nr:ABC-F type ribosomal protection protein [Clostridia bacterium]